jgi:hypothetical protein
MEYLFERETQFLQFTPISFIDKVIDLANRQAHYSLDRLQDYIDEQIGECPENERVSVSKMAMDGLNDNDSSK